MAIAPIGAAGAISLQQLNPTTATSATKATDGNTFTKALDAASQLGAQADTLAGQVSTGQLNNIQTYSAAAAKAELAVDLTVAIRNRAIDAYQEIMRMSV